MSRLGRLAGALLLETAGTYYLIGNLKEPCNWAAAGFEPPGQEVNGMQTPVLRLLPCAAADIPAQHCCVLLTGEGEAVAQLLARRLLIQRNGSVSDRLWRLITDPEDTGEVRTLAAPWLIEVPNTIWDIVRDNVLRCS